jgi:hypothetical protein
MERYFPGGPRLEPATMRPDDESYLRAHSERSAQIVGEWLRAEGAGDELAADVERLVRLHEIGGDPEADLLQAADSISFLEVNRDLPLRWAHEGRCSVARGLEQHRWMFERIELARACALARPYYEEAVRRAA